MNRRDLLASLALLPVAGAVGHAQEVKKPHPLKDLPPLWGWKEGEAAYRVDPYIAAAAALQAEPKTAADTLEMLIKDADNEHDHANKALILCRMLFTAKPKGEFRRPRLGGPLFLDGGEKLDWPLEPIELVDGVPFLVVWGYSLGGAPEPASKYLSYCLKECDWTAEKYKPKGKEAKEKALAKLLADKRWKDGVPKELLSDQLK